MEAQTSLAIASTQPRASTQPLTGKVVALLAGLAAISMLSTNIILPAFADIGEDLGVTARELGLTLSSFFITFALGQLVVGPLADRYGRQKLVLGGLSVFVVGTVIAGLATTLDVLIAGRVVQALGVCAASVLSRAIARDLFEGETLARALSLTMIATAAAPGFSPLAGSVLSVTLGWRAIFILVGLAAVVLAFFYVRDLGETHPADRRAPHSAKSVVLAYGRLALDKRFILPALSMSLLMSGLFASFAAAPAILMQGIGLTSLQTGLYFASTVFVVFAAGMAAPRLAHRHGARIATLVGIACAMAGGGLLLVGPAAPGLGWYALSMITFLWGMGLANPLGTAITMGPFGKEAGMASALLGFLSMGAAALTTWLASVLSFAPVTTLGGIQTTACLVALMLFLFRGRL
ncbi:multidrug effflux MFS transporter [Pseudomonas brassicacearum]|uniref:multidrug effflux MFS transporter n=1 Tax=Pseudomonas TaxID=286 RepID=UPI0002600493|nr:MULTISPECIES: multidrug effflux MFS transporter [Pseudomonas]EIK64585.1 drug resistance transporter, Bcr/CflA family [Pseudomonas fluorescens Q8r1-96]KAB0528285.1 multidrug effflux MFS transporter [Pseudomonas brassicacearum subsp. brassicacearum]NJP59512.1 multidrug effflux MFS transporter [Pseudomonas brassicacearum]QEO78193.1 Bcr/CflA family efflux MFS transporter [Pseudomonas brassicacearum]ROM86347.1 Bcr/CflA family drug resistance efflux transporter [Pseudomonas brassicacearum]